MSILRRSAAAVALAIGTFGSVGFVELATPTPSAAQPTCTDNWVGPDTGTTNWNASASNWSSGFPGGASIVCISEAGTYTVLWNGSGSAAAVEVGAATSGTQTFEINGGNFPSTQDDEVESGGVLSLVPSSSSDADFTGGGSNDLTIDAGGELASSGTTEEADIGLPMDNQGTVTLGATTTVDSAATTNEGSFSVSNGATLNESGGFTDSSGTLVVNGTFDAANNFTQSGTTESGNPVTLSGTLADSAGTGAFTLVPSGPSITGTIPTGQTVTVLGTNAVVGTSSSGVTDDGTLNLITTTGSDADVSANSTWPGLTVAAGATLSTSGTLHQADIGAPILNQGTVTFGATTNVVTQDATNSGTLTVMSGSSVTTSGAVFTDASGKLVNDGSFNGENEFIQSGTIESGNPVHLDANPFIDSAGTGSFTTYQSLIEGTIPVGQTVTNLSSPGNSNDVVGTGSAGVTVAGTLIGETVSGTICTFSAGNNMWPGITVAPGGLLETTGPGNTTGTNVQLGTNIDVEAGGTVIIANPQTTFNDQDTLTNDGTLQVAATGFLNIGGNNVVDSPGGSTIGVTTGQVGDLGTFYDTSSFGFTATGTLAVAGGSASNEAVITVPNGGLGADFTSFSFGSSYYTVTYTATQVGLNSATPFNASRTVFSAAEGEPVTPEVASFNTNGEPGTYSATVDYGDGSGAQVAVVNLSGGGGTITGPTHTYPSAGSFPLTVVISTTAGTTQTLTGSVTVTGPTITGLSKVTVKPGKKLSTIVKGTNFDGTGVPSGFGTSDPSHISVLSVKAVKATKRHGAEYKVKFSVTRTAPAESVSVTLTQTGIAAGKTTDRGAFTIS
jgi:hypothetical protein